MVVFQVLSGPNFQNTFQKRKVNAPKMLPSKELTYPPEKAYFKIIFLFPRWDISISWRVSLPGANAEFDWLYRFLLHRLVLVTTSTLYLNVIEARSLQASKCLIYLDHESGLQILTAGITHPPTSFIHPTTCVAILNTEGAMKSLQNSHASYLLSREVRPVASRPYEQWK